MIEQFNECKTIKEISIVVEFSEETVRKCLKKNGYEASRRPSVIDKFNMLSDDKRDEIIYLYQNGEIDKILKIYSNFSKNQIYSLMSELKISNNKYFWSEEDKQILINNFGKKSYSELETMMEYRHNAKAISTKAIKLNLTKTQSWSNEEIEILKLYYSKLPKEEFVKLLPNRSYNASGCKARQLGIKSYGYLNEKYSDTERQYIIDNFGKLTDQEIANDLNRTLHGIQDMRRKLGLYYLNKDYSQYESLSKFFRGHISDWKTKSMAKCNYGCIFTGSKDFAVHHIYSFNTILSEFYEYLDSTNLLKSNKIEDYTKEELDNMIYIFNQIHSKYPLGICIRKDIHDLFHNIYGAGGNTQEQWDTFKENYYNHFYDNQLIA